MKKLFFALALICAGATVYAQSSLQHNDPNAGHFDIVKTTTKGVERINVNYSITAPPIYNTLRLNLNTPDPMAMSAKIVNTGGHTVLTWKPEQANYTYGVDLDIAALKAGKYTIDVYGPDNSKVFSIPFEKSTGAN